MPNKAILLLQYRVPLHLTEPTYSKTSTMTPPSRQRNRSSPTRPCKGFSGCLWIQREGREVTGMKMPSQRGSVLKRSHLYTGASVGKVQKLFLYILMHSDYTLGQNQLLINGFSESTFSVGRERSHHKLHHSSESTWQSLTTWCTSSLAWLVLKISWK